MSTLRVVLGAVFVAHLLSASNLEAQAATNLEGIWEVTWAQGVRTQGDELVEVQRWGAAELTLSVSGDSVSGTWQAMGDTWRLTGTYQGGRLRLASHGSDADDPQMARTGLRLSGVLSGDRLEGEIWLMFPARAGGGAPRPWRAILSRQYTWYTERVARPGTQASFSAVIITAFTPKASAEFCVDP